MSARFRSTLELLASKRVEIIVVGGVAAVLQGAPIVTFDLDLVHRRTEENVRRLLGALTELQAQNRGDPRGLSPTESQLLGPGRVLLTTVHGPVDVLGVVANGLTYEDLIPDTVSLDLGGISIPVLGLSRLIEVKQAVGRPKDLAVLPTLRATLEESRRLRT
ncbi:MAG: hypothetical protein ABIQ65_05400 [Thermoanaerobaculia bacterium]